MYQLQRCRSHETNNIPRAWEVVQSGTEAEIVAEYFSRSGRGASGDHYRIVDEDGEQQAIISSTECGPFR